MIGPKYLSWGAVVLLLGCAVGSADNGSRSDWVGCETEGDCGDGQSCVEQRCQAVEPEPAPDVEVDPDTEGDDAPSTGSAPDASMPPAMESDPAREVKGSDATDDGNEPVGMATEGTNSSGVPGAERVDGGVDLDAATPDAGVDGGELPAEDSGATCTESSPCYSPAQCVQGAVSAAGSECFTQGTCTQQVEIDGVVEERDAYLSLYCTTTNGNVYQCSCSGAGNLMVTGVGADGVAACAQALSNCGARIRL